MYKILITSGPTREYLDPVRFISNASSGKMGAALAASAIEFGFEVVIISGPVQVSYPKQAQVIQVETTEQMLDACVREFPLCDGVIAAAAPCDYKPVCFSPEKIAKTGTSIQMEFQSTPDILAALGAMKNEDQWTIGFALETNNGLAHAQEKLLRKNCDFICLNALSAIDSKQNSIDIISREGVLAHISGEKRNLAAEIIKLIGTFNN